MTDVGIHGDTIDVARGELPRRSAWSASTHPSRGECWYEEATETLTDLVGSGPVWLAVDTTEVDQFGRALRYVFDADGQDVGGSLVEQGRGDRQELPAGYRQRRPLCPPSGGGAGPTVAGCGHPACTTGSSSSDPQPVAHAPVDVGIEIHPDAAGDDNANLDDEWVRFTNSGAAALDLAGWGVRDESSSHRYTFSDLFLAPGDAVTLFTGCGIDSPTERCTGAAPILRCGTTGVTRSFCSTRPATSPPRVRTERRRHRSGGQPPNSLT